MPTKRKRYSVSLPREIQDIIEKDACINRRKVANQIMWVLDQWMQSNRAFAANKKLTNSEENS